MEKNKTTKDIGNLSGEILVFGGVYSNLQALEALVEICFQRKIPPSNIICTGDIVAYCAQPESCLQLIKEWGIHCILGNVEEQIREGLSDCACDFEEGGRCDTLSKDWYPFAKKVVSQNSVKWMQSLPHFIRFDFGGKKGIVVHGSSEHISSFIFGSTPWKTKETVFLNTQTDIVLAGHCGLPFSQEKEGKYWLNAGVIGMPANDGNPDVWYMILKEGIELTYEHCSFKYDYKTAQQLMKTNCLPEAYAKTLGTGIWDNCEILPEIETKRQGFPIIF